MLIVFLASLFEWLLPYYNIRNIYSININVGDIVCDASHEIYAL